MRIHKIRIDDIGIDMKTLLLRNFNCPHCGLPYTPGTKCLCRYPAGDVIITFERSRVSPVLIAMLIVAVGVLVWAVV